VKEDRWHNNSADQIDGINRIKQNSTKIQPNPGLNEICVLLDGSIA